VEADISPSRADSRFDPEQTSDVKERDAPLAEFMLGGGEFGGCDLQIGFFVICVTADTR
jgi:hypothetical protein